MSENVYCGNYKVAGGEELEISAKVVDAGVLAVATESTGRFVVTPDSLATMPLSQRNVVCTVIHNLLRQNTRSNKLVSAVSAALETHADLEVRPSQR